MATIWEKNFLAIKNFLKHNIKDILESSIPLIIDIPESTGQYYFSFSMRLYEMQVLTGDIKAAAELYALFISDSKLKLLLADIAITVEYGNGWLSVQRSSQISFSSIDKDPSWIKYIEIHKKVESKTAYYAP